MKLMQPVASGAGRDSSPATPAAHTPATSGTPFRPDIEGLRAIAVLAIVLFHIGYKQLPGGYVGVDIFFVISGFLIGRNITTGIDAGTFKLSTFYRARIKRIFPAFAVTVLVTTIVSVLLLFPTSLIDYAKSALSTLVYGSNFYFWTTAGYFDAPAASKPLLHTWSLAVEEQFYVVLPLLLMMLKPMSRQMVTWIVIGVAAASLALCVVFTTMQPEAAFYLLPFRAWELLMGVIIARLPEWTTQRDWLRNAVAGAGLVLIAVSIVVFTEEMAFPGWIAIIPCAGAAMVIASGTGMAGRGKQTLVHRMVGIWPMRWTGRVSYSMYLWHWPLIVLAKEAIPAEYFSGTGKIIVLVATVAMAWLSWRFIEEPLRHTQASKKTVFGAYAAASVALAVFAGALVALNGMPGRFPPKALEAARLINNNDAILFNDGACMMGTGNSKLSDFDPSKCLKRDPARTNVLLFGDSHMDHFWQGLDARWPEINFMMAAGTGCQPTLTRPHASTPACDVLMDYMFKEYLPASPPDYVVMSGQFRKGNIPAVLDTLAWFRKQGIKVIFVAPTPEWTVAVSQLVALSRVRNQPDLADMFQQPLEKEFDELPKQMPADDMLSYVWPAQVFCDGDKCRTVGDNDDPIMWDISHFGAEGSIMAARAFDNVAPFNQHAAQTATR